MMTDFTGAGLQRLLNSPTCSHCGCSELNPCPEGCHWVGDDLCSLCAGGTRTITPPFDPTPRHGLQLIDKMGEEETSLRHRAELSIYMGTGPRAPQALVMSRDVIHGKEGPPRVRGGHVLTREQIAQLITGIQNSAPIRVVLPANVVMWDGLRVAWWVPSARRRIWFSPKSRKDLQHVSRQEVWHPPLLFIADPGHLQLYALRENERPKAATQLFQAPYPNIYETGGVCQGGVDWPKTLDLDRLHEWERKFFESEGTFPTAARLTLFPGGHVALWTAMLTAETFPTETLVPVQMTLLDAINHTERPRTLPFVNEEIVPVPPALENANA